MKELWYYADGREAKGPVTFDHLFDVLTSAPQAERIIVWKHGFEEWTKARELPEFQSLFTRPPSVPPREPSDWTKSPTGFATAFFGFTGRMGRTEYVTVLVASLVVALVLSVLVVPSIENEAIQKPLWVACVILSVWVRLASSWKRFHDFNWSGFNSFRLVVPAVNIFLFFFLIFKRGSDGDNDYGPPLLHFSDDPKP